MNKELARAVWVRRVFDDSVVAWNLLQRFWFDNKTTEYYELVQLGYMRTFIGWIYHSQINLMVESNSLTLTHGTYQGQLRYVQDTIDDDLSTCIWGPSGTEYIVDWVLYNIKVNEILRLWLNGVFIILLTKKNNLCPVDQSSIHGLETRKSFEQQKWHCAL